jgi:hypothetical protein
VRPAVSVWRGQSKIKAEDDSLIQPASRPEGKISPPATSLVQLVLPLVVQAASDCQYVCAGGTDTTFFKDSLGISGSLEEYERQRLKSLLTPTPWCQFVHFTNLGSASNRKKSVLSMLLQKSLDMSPCSGEVFPSLLTLWGRCVRHTPGPGPRLARLARLLSFHTCAVHLFTPGEHHVTGSFPSRRTTLFGPLLCVPRCPQQSGRSGGGSR